ncbi:hypothetical protein BLNAU_21546 [Blattamonas nauphoetae]|uniref:Uncharacterized protein n=1 Tax=Blattamonas nauphoetae TaxID=2049346 RepID=A0ABQ9WVK7_9EUKA|nr:hypothetical protein BLNAU_21546 [Blattamonas nauphoetae]
MTVRTITQIVHTLGRYSDHNSHEDIDDTSRSDSTSLYLESPISFQLAPYFAKRNLQMSSSLRRTLTYLPEFHPVKAPEFHRDNSQCDLTSPAELRSRKAIIETNLNSPKRFSDPNIHTVSGRTDCAQSHIITTIINFTNMQSHYDELTSLGSLLKANLLVQDKQSENRVIMNGLKILSTRITNLSALRHENDVEGNMNSSSTYLTPCQFAFLLCHVQTVFGGLPSQRNNDSVQLSPDCCSLFDLSSHTLGTGTDEANEDLIFNDTCPISATTGAKQASTRQMDRSSHFHALTELIHVSSDLSGGKGQTTTVDSTALVGHSYGDIMPDVQMLIAPYSHRTLQHRRWVPLFNCLT